LPTEPSAVACVYRDHVWRIWLLPRLRRAGSLQSAVDAAGQDEASAAAGRADL